MSPKQLSNEKEYLETRNNPRLSINSEDVGYLINLAKLKGFKDEDVFTLYVVAAEGLPEVGEGGDGTYVIYNSEDLREMSTQVDRLLYDEKNKRLIGFLPPLPVFRNEQSESKS